MSGSRPSHPPTLLRLAERELRTEALVARGDRVLVGVSGGPDSMALLHVLGRLRERLGFELVGCGVDHGLRAEAGAELELARGLANELGVAFEVVRIQVERGGNLQARAREQRLQALRQVAARLEANEIALAHHANDRAETVLIRLLQGAGPAGMAALPARSGDLIRPLIRARRADILAHLQRHNIAFATDPSNADPHYLRARVRFQLLPLLEAMCPKAVAHLCQLADDLGALGLDRLAPTRKRAHLQALGLAASGKRGVRVALPAGQVACFDPNTQRIVIEPSTLDSTRPK